MIVIPLGTNGFFPSYDRQTACFAIPAGKTLIILDAGSGLFRLGEKKVGKLLTEVSYVHLFLSHYHLDHTFGFNGASRLLKEKKVTVFAKDTFKVFSDLSKNYFPNDYDEEYKNFSWVKLKTGDNKIGDYKVTVRKQFHNGAGSIAMRFDFGLTYVTDSEPTKEGTEFLSGTKLLLHEHYLTGDEILKSKAAKLEDHFSGKHVTTVGAAFIAKEVRIGKLALIHHFPFYDNEKLQKQLKVARSIFPNTILAQDLKPIEF